MKTCTKCKIAKPFSEFSLQHPAKKDGKLRADCKECVRARSKKQRISDPNYIANLTKVKKEAVQKAKSFVEDYLSQHPCVDCGETDIEVLDFDHVRGSKICDVSKMVKSGYRLWRIKEEIEKCEVRCANDHRRITAKRRREKQALLMLVVTCLPSKQNSSVRFRHNALIWGVQRVGAVPRTDG